MHCPEYKKSMKPIECTRHILQTDNAGLARCQLCEHGQELMASTPFYTRDQDATTTTEEPGTATPMNGTTPEKALPLNTVQDNISMEVTMPVERIYTAKDIARLANVSMQQVYGAKNRALKGAVPTMGISKKIADTMKKHGITWDMLTNARELVTSNNTNKAGEQDKGTQHLYQQPHAQSPAQAQGAPEGVPSIPVQHPTQPAELTQEASNTPHTSTAQRETLRTERPYGKGNHNQDTINICKVSASLLVYELKRRFPNATITLTL